MLLALTEGVSDKRKHFFEYFLDNWSRVKRAIGAIIEFTQLMITLSKPFVIGSIIGVTMYHQRTKYIGIHQEKHSYWDVFEENLFLMERTLYHSHVTWIPVDYRMQRCNRKSFNTFILLYHSVIGREQKAARTTSPSSEANIRTNNWWCRAKCIALR